MLPENAPDVTGREYSQEKTEGRCAGGQSRAMGRILVAACPSRQAGALMRAATGSLIEMKVVRRTMRAAIAEGAQIAENHSRMSLYKLLSTLLPALHCR